MTDHPTLQPGSYYHIYNRANGKENLFNNNIDYQWFLLLYDKYISPVADTFAWVLMANHFHFLVRMQEGVYYRYSKENFKTSSSNADRTAIADAVRFEDVKWETVSLSASTDPSVSTDPSASIGPDGIVTITSKRKKANPTNHFSHLFNAYAKYVNDKYDRHGSLFQRPFKRKPVEDEDYLQQMVLYIHYNPVHHGFAEHPSDYPWSSYPIFMSKNPAKLQREVVLDWFGGMRNFQEMHNEYSPNKIKNFDAWLNKTGNPSASEGPDGVT